MTLKNRSHIWYNNPLWIRAPREKNFQSGVEHVSARTARVYLLECCQPDQRGFRLRLQKPEASDRSAESGV